MDKKLYDQLFTAAKPLSGEPNKKPGKLGKLVGNTAGMIGFAIIAILAILLAVIVSVISSFKEDTNRAEAPAKAHLIQNQANDSEQGVIRLTDEWHSFVIPKGKRIDVKLLENFVWQTMADKDPNRVYTHVPERGLHNDHMEITNSFSVLDVRIKPGQDVTGNLVYAISEFGSKPKL